MAATVACSLVVLWSTLRGTPNLRFRRWDMVPVRFVTPTLSTATVALFFHCLTQPSSPPNNPLPSRSTCSTTVCGWARKSLTGDSCPTQRKLEVDDSHWSKEEMSRRVGNLCNSLAYGWYAIFMPLPHTNASRCIAGYSPCAAAATATAAAAAATAGVTARRAAAHALGGHGRLPIRQLGPLPRTRNTCAAPAG